MKKHKQIIQQYIVLSLLVIYQVIGLVHIAYLPRQNDAFNLHPSSSIDFLHKNTNSNLPRVPFQRSFHSFESRKDLTAPTKVLILFFAFLLIGGTALIIAKRANGTLAAPYFHTSSSYLNLRTLRI
ncbi:hypothetical protein [Mucilaginibacter dorajii]|uniref:hypothetical protein n=1 Tax=Mucilaginibacter dorajii TaxID=692994 RepID=UPI00216903B8|nr:hypothetical protein [Mucilaginibacter dorajii]MCS3732533.1 hypothetical protein [Mucilaginibacter dorajii]